MPRNARDENKDYVYTVTNLTESRSLNCNANDDLATADVLGQLINDLKALGVLPQ